jgi:DNA-binding PadR family transcriptional regulator
MADKNKVVIDWEAEQRKIEEEYKAKLAELKKLREDNEMVDRILTRGILPTVVLNMIHTHASNGNEISNRIADVTEGAWQPSTGGIYPILKRFEKQGFIVGEWDDPEKRVKKIYATTPKGEEELEKQKPNLISNLNKTVEVFNSIIKSFE